MPFPQNRLENTPFDVYYNLLAGDPDDDEVTRRAERMGYEVDGTRLTAEDGTSYLFDRDGLKARMAASSRDVVIAGGGMVGAVAGSPGGIVGAGAGGVSGAMMAGNAMDLAMGREQTQTPMGQLNEFSSDMGGEALGLLGGKALQSVADVAGPYIKRAYVSIKNGVKTARDRILGENTSDEILNSRESIEELLDYIARGDAERIDPEPDIEIARAAQRMGIDLQADQYSKNPRFVEIVQGLKSMPDSTLRAGELDVIAKLKAETDDIMNSAGNTDVAGVSDDILKRWGSASDKIGKKAGEIYGRIAQTKNLRLSKFKPLSTHSLITRAEEEGPLMGLHLQIKNMLGDQETVTYAYLDKVRKNIGQGYKGRGPFKDAASHELDEVYGALTEDQFRIARAFGKEKDLMVAHKLVEANKKLQEKMIGVFGKDLSKDLASSLKPAVSGLVEGRHGKFRKVMNSIPVGQRKEVAGTALQYYLVGTKGHLTPAFIDRYEKLTKNATARNELYKYLPKHVKTRVDDLYKVAKGVFGSQARSNNSRTARDMMVAMSAKEGFIRRLQGAAASTAMTASGVRGGGAIGMLFSQNPNTFSKRAEALLASPKFVSMAEAGFGAKNLKAAENSLSKTYAYKEWIKAQPQETQAFIAGQGLFRYIFGQ